ncbi:aminoglycoside phosphotransferase family protein [Nocardia elegans]|uniref:Aminoglycoside phosphotransferase family protein n=1 Tax=Nocardia elegans TaxID=300029 RepID=A0ABW6TJN2_9NOCA
MATSISPDRAAELHAAVVEACNHIDVDPSGAELIKYTVNAVYALDAPIVVRVGSGDVGHYRGTRLIETANWLTRHDAPTIRLVDAQQPVFIGDFTITFWHKAHHRERWTASDLAHPLRALHLLPTDDADLPHWDPFETARHRLAAADDGISADDLQWLQDAWLQVEQNYRTAEFSMPFVLLHGDPHVGNLLIDHRDRIVLCDLDESAVGPMAWDLVPQAVGATRFNRANFYRDFAAAYGVDVRDLPEWPVLARIRELIMVTSVLPDLGQRPGIAAEQAHRLASLRSGDAATVWHPYQ